MSNLLKPILISWVICMTALRSVDSRSRSTSTCFAEKLLAGSPGGTMWLGTVDVAPAGLVIVADLVYLMAL